MIGTPIRTKKRNPLATILLPLLTLLLMAGACFAFCWILWWLNEAGAPPSF
jgi:hypothetical protein